MAVTRTDRVRLADTDASGLIFFGAAVGWMARAAEDLLLSLGIGVFADPPMRAPVRSLEVSYESAMRLYDEYEHRTWISKVGTSSLAVSHAIVVGGRVCVRGTATSVMISERGEPIPIPEKIRGALEEAMDTSVSA